MKALKSCLVCLVSYCEKHIQPHYDSPAFEKHELVDPSKNLQENISSSHDEVMKMFCRTDQQCICSLCLMDEHKGHDTVEEARVEQMKKKGMIRFQHETEVSRVKELQEKLDQEITELKRKDAELKKISDIEDHIQFLQNYPSLSPLSESTDSSSINIRPLRYFEDVTAAESEVRDKLQDVLRDTWTNISLIVTEVDVLLPQPEPKTRADFLKNSCEITLDPNTAHRQLLLSEGNRKAKLVGQQQRSSSHPDRFTNEFQVLSRESLTGRCYWEVEWRGEVIYVAVSYKNISRACSPIVCRFGWNDKSWALRCDKKSYTFLYNDIQTVVPGPVSSRVGVYLDHRAGTLSFYSVSDTMTLLHRVQTTFTQPLYAGLLLHSSSFGDTAELCKLK
ncbi:tripartite motif-containing protein 16-like [Perca fluviatilis]|uniref:tripartite motif-containing protein 16-like n=1 Tax=Perca fluviatilis TaxID=8168 RepID=UPI0019636CBF|nr:tripartite motif-containing protein 16-like [Perca fluviatilis]